ncbi:MAG: AMP-binding protein [Acidimicrobiales bacterium]|nr:AMP-binding protein [Acidimicrobiales bacterium]
MAPSTTWSSSASPSTADPATVELDLAAIHEALAARLGDRPCLIWRGRTWSWAEVTDRTRRFAAVLGAHGIGRRRDLADCAGWESPHDHVGLYLQNGNAYLEAQLGATKAGAAAFNVNYRYVAEELAYLFDDSSAAAIVYQGCYASVLADVLDGLARRPLLLRVDDGSGDELLPGALDYEEALASVTPIEAIDSRPDDLYVLYTGGTTGNPKGVLWRQADFLVAALGVRRKDGTDHESLDELVEAGLRRNLATLPAPPLMHGAAMWNALSTWIGGGTIVIQDRVDHLDPADVWDACERHGVSSLLIVGDAFARPLLDEQRARPRDLSALRFVLTGGAILSPAVRTDLLDLLPQVRVVDVLGSSESGRQAVASTEAATDDHGPTRFAPSATAAVLAAELDGILAPGDPEIGWLAQSGRIPRGYLGDEAKTRATFPEVAGRRWSVPGDRARWREDRTIELHGRDSVTINTGGEKVFAEEVEQVLKGHPGVYDVLVVGRPSATWGQEVVAVVALAAGEEVSLEELRDLGGEHLARYKLPKAVVLAEQISRSPSGKPDYAWARELAARAAAD